MITDARFFELRAKRSIIENRVNRHEWIVAANEDWRVSDATDSRVEIGVTRIRCRAAPCSEARGPFDHFEIRVSTLRFELTRISK
jgi:hypothetical protein